ncbi:MAG: ABC transporter permease [Fervidobacterium sp.]|nr:ABC transporter permease [Fervidobacterium sp.]
MRKEFYDMRVRIVGTLFTLVVLFFIVAPFQKFTLRMLEGYSGTPQLEKFLPPSMLNKLKEWDFYINSQWYGKNFGQIVPIVGIIMAFPLFAREVENGTIAFLLVRKNRKQVFINKFFSGLISLWFILLFTGLLPIFYSFALNKDYQYLAGIKFTTQSLFAGLLWFCITLFYSVIFDDQVKPLLAGLSTLAITTVAGMLKPLKFLNTYTYALGNSIFLRNSIDFKYTFGVIILSLIITLLAYGIFLKKEV